MPIDPTIPPDPANSPLEKLVLPRRNISDKDLSKYFLKYGVDSDLAEKIGRGLQDYERDKYYLEQQNRIDLEYWANIHTHGGLNFGPIPGLSVDWAHEWWADDPEWEQPSDGAISWDNDEGGWTSTARDNKITGGEIEFTLNDTAWNNKATIRRDNTPLVRLRDVNASGPWPYPQPYSIVFVCQPLNLNSTTNRHLIGWAGVSVYARSFNLNMFAGTTLTGSVSWDPNNPSVVTMIFDGADSVAYHNNLKVMEGDAGTAALGGTGPSTDPKFRLGSTDSGTFNMNLKMGYLSMLDRRITDDEREEVLDAMNRFYGTPK